MNKTKRTEIGEKIRKHVQENFEVYLLSVLMGGMGLVAYSVGGRQARISAEHGFRYGQKVGWNKGYIYAVDQVVDHVLDSGEPITYKFKDGVEYLIDVTLKKTI